MRDALGRHHHDFPLDQLELLVLADHAGFDHAADVLDREGPARETFGSCGGGNVHATSLAIISFVTIGIYSTRRRSATGNLGRRAVCSSQAPLVRRATRACPT